MHINCYLLYLIYFINMKSLLIDIQVTLVMYFLTLYKNFDLILIKHESFVKTDFFR